MTSAIEFGHQTDALTWIETANASEDDKRKLIVFVERFPNLEYYHFLRPMGPKIVQWLVDLRAGLGGFELRNSVFVKYQNLELYPDRGESEGEILYNWDFSLVLSAEFKKVYVGDEQLLIVSAWLHNLSSILAIKANHPNDKKVYEFAYKSVKLDESRPKVGLLSEEDMRDILPSYSELFTHITKIVSRQDNQPDTIHVLQS